MSLGRKKPCTICRRWFTPDPRIGKRQRACHKPECQAELRKRTQAAWRGNNPDYFIAWRMQKRASQKRRLAPLRLPAPLSRLPWDVAQDEFAVQGADFIGVMGKLLLQVTKDQLRPQRLDLITVVGTHAHQQAQDQMQLGP